MNFKTTLILLVLLALGGGYIIWDNYSKRDKEPETAADTKKLFDAKADDVTSLTIKSSDNSEIVLSKDDKGKWRMTKPVESAAESWQVDGLARDLVNLEPKYQVEPAGHGFEAPKFKIEISAKGGKLLKFSVGEKNQLGDMYIQVEGQKKAQVVSSEVYERLSRPANDLRDKQLVSTPSTDIRQLTIETEGQKLVMQKKGSEWELMEPKKLPVDDSVATDLLGAVTGLRATDWIAKDSPDVGKAQFDKPQMTVSFTTAAPATQPTTAPASQPQMVTIVFGQYEDIRHNKIYARISDSQATVKTMTNAFDTLTKKPIELRDKKVLDILPEQVSKLSILTDLPAGAAPTTKPAKKTEVVIERRKQVAAATTQATSKPTTRPSTTQAATTQAAATQPAAAPPSTWALLSAPKGDADDTSVSNLLAELHPLRVTKYHESTPTTKPTGNYVIKFTTEGPGGTPVTQYEVKLIDPGSDQGLLGEYNGLSFELPRTFLTKLEGDFAKKPKTETIKPPTADDFKGPGEK